MRTYAIRGARTKITGHLRQDGTRTTYCNRPVGIPNGDFTGLKGWKMCTRCVKAEARDRAHAVEVAAQHAEPSTPAAKLTEWERDLLAANVAPTPRYTTADENAAIADRAAPHPIETYYTLYCTTHGNYHPCDSQQRHDYMHCTLDQEERTALLAGDVPPWCYSTADEDAPGARKRPTDADRAAAAEESRYAAELITEAEADDGTWRSEWIGDTTALFDRPTEQGSLFA